MKNQTAVEWLLNNLLINGLLRFTKDEHSLYKELKDQALEMEKEQIKNAYVKGQSDCEIFTMESESEHYYTQTFTEPKNDWTHENPPEPNRIAHGRNWRYFNRSETTILAPTQTRTQRVETGLLYKPRRNSGLFLYLYISEPPP